MESGATSISEAFFGPFAIGSTRFSSQAISRDFALLLLVQNRASHHGLLSSLLMLCALCPCRSGGLHPLHSPCKPLWSTPQWCCLGTPSIAVQNVEPPEHRPALPCPPSMWALWTKVTSCSPQSVHQMLEMERGHQAMLYCIKMNDCVKVICICLKHPDLPPPLDPSKGHPRGQQNFRAPMEHIAMGDLVAWEPYSSPSRCFHFTRPPLLPPPPLPSTPPPLAPPLSKFPKGKSTSSTKKIFLSIFSRTKSK